jgi:hypothetical protein
MFADIKVPELNSVGLILPYVFVYYLLHYVRPRK